MAVKKYKHRVRHSTDDFQFRRKPSAPPGGGIDPNNRSRPRSSRVRDSRLLTQCIASKLQRVVEEFDDQTVIDENCPPVLLDQSGKAGNAREMADAKKWKNHNEDRPSDDLTPRDLAEISRITAVPPTAQTSPNRRRERCEPEIDASIAAIASSLMIASPVSHLNSTFNYPLHSTLLTNIDGDIDDVISTQSCHRRGRIDVNKATSNGYRTESETEDKRLTVQTADDGPADDVTLGPERRRRLVDAVRSALLAGKIKEMLGGSTTTTVTTDSEVGGVRLTPVEKPTEAAAAVATVTAADGESNVVDDLLHRTYCCRRREGGGQSADDVSSLSGLIVQPRHGRRNDDGNPTWLRRTANVAGRLAPYHNHDFGRCNRQTAGARRPCHQQSAPRSAVHRDVAVVADLAALTWKSTVATVEGRPPVHTAGLVRQTGSSHLQLLGSWRATTSTHSQRPAADRKRQLKRRKDGMTMGDAGTWKRRSSEIKKRLREFRRMTIDEKDRRLEVKFMGFV
jgi:hypothetical protein